MQQIDEWVHGVCDLLMKAYQESSATAPHPVLDTDLTSSQIIRLSLKAPGLLVMPGPSVKRECADSGSEDESCSTKRLKLSPNGSVSDAERCTECVEMFDNAALLLDHTNKCHHTTPQSPEHNRTQSPAPDSEVSVQGSPVTQAQGSPATTQMSEQQEEYRQRPQFRKCILCNIMFGSNEQLAAHFSTAHRNQETWNCIAHTTCPMVFTDIRSLRTHVYEFHIKECPVCKCRFEETSLARHIICTHAELTTCPICGVQYNDQHNLMVHVKLQHDLSTPRDRYRTESTLSVKSEAGTP